LLIGIGISVVIKFIIIVMSPPKKNFKHGQEYGSARWGTPADIAPYIDKNPYHNILLSATEKLSMEGRMPNMEHNRNKNVEIVGGSGSGKTFSYVTPNIIQCDCSYVVTDPKGTILENVGYLMRKKGYVIKVLNTIDFTKSMHYNPFAYIKTEEDILSTVSQMFEALKAEDAGSGGDPFWNDAAELFLCSIFALIHYEAPPEEQNMTTFLEFFNSYEVSEEDEGFKNGVDLVFDELEQKNPDHFAVRQYKKFKMAAGVISYK
jgi:type IV secretion system protein VirD4